MNVRFCASCRSLILADFLYCPYCGAAVGKGPTLDEAVSGSFKKLGGSAGEAAGPGEAEGAASAAASGDSPFAQAERGLDRLEAEMELLIEELEREGRSST
jgi:hypothetical protein